MGVKRRLKNIIKAALGGEMKLAAPKTPTLSEQYQDPQQAGKDWSLGSMERQAGKTLDTIRRDHMVRYELAAKLLKENEPNCEEALGLDAFCGTGYGSYHIAETTGCRLIGIDGSFDAVAFGETHFSHPNVLLGGKIFPFNLPPEHFDFAVSFESVEHVDAYEEFLAMLYRVVKPGGMLFLSTPNEDILSLERNPHKFHFKHFAFDETVELLSRSGDVTLVDWYGQDCYRMEDGIQKNSLPESEMGLRHHHRGQFQVYVFRKS